MTHSQFFTSHYILLKDGSLGEWPIVEISDSGEVLSIELHPEGLTEKPGMQLHGGLLMAGLVDVGFIPDSAKLTQRIINRHFSAGTLFLGTSTANSSFLSPPFLIDSMEDRQCPFPFINRDNDNFEIPLLHRLRLMCSRNSSLNWLDLLNKAEEWIFDQRSDLSGIGRVEPGNKCGLMVVKNLDLLSMKMTGDMYIKWLSVPSF